MVHYQPEGYGTVTASLQVEGAGDLIKFIEKVFGGSERMRFEMDDGRIAHAEITIGDSLVMIGEANELMPAQQGVLHVYVPDVDKTYREALAAGATKIMEPENQFYGARSANVKDRWGNHWSLATQVEDVSEKEMESRMATARVG